MNNLEYPSRKTIERLSNDLNLKNTDAFTQDWECEVVDVEKISEYLLYYKTSSLNRNEKITLIRLILEAYNDYICLEKEEDLYGKEIENILNNDYSVHEDTIKYWACENEELENCFAITPFIRRIIVDKEKSIS